MIKIVYLFKEIWWQLLLAIALWIGIIFYTKTNPQKLLERIEKNAVKVNIEGETIYLKKSGFFIKDWHIIHPPINEDGSVNEMNRWFGGKSNLINTILIVLLIGLSLIGMYEIISSYNAIISNPLVQSCLNGLNIQLGN